MTDLKTAAQQALEWLDEESWPGFDEWVQEVRAIRDALRAALAEPNDDYERGFVDGMKKQAQSSVDKAVNGLTLPTCKDALQVEPVAWMYPDDYERMVSSEAWAEVFSVQVSSPTQGKTTVPLYTHPAPQRQPLTQEEAWDMWDALGDRGKKGEDIVLAFTRAIEKAHGIPGETK